MKDLMTIATVNMKIRSMDKAYNSEKMLRFAEEASEKGADLILFPEMCLTGYDYFIDPKNPMEVKREMAEDLQGEVLLKAAEMTKKYGNYFVYGAAERCPETGDLYNSAFVTGPEGVIGTYRKIHPFAAENYWCKEGTEPFLLDTPWGPVGIGICFDSYQFPELMRYYVYKGARLYLNLTALVEEIDKEGSREAFRSYYSLLDYGVLCNTIYVASANLTGYDIDSYFGGGSCVLGPKVTPFYETQVTCYGGDRDNIEETLDLVTVDLSLAKRRLCRKSRISGKMDFRPALYQTFEYDE